MDRREAFKKIAALLGGVALTPELLAKAMDNPAPTLANIPPNRLATLAEMADTILPTTDTPGAKAAKTEEFIVMAVENCLNVKDRKNFWEGLTAADEACIKTNKKTFVESNEQQRTALLKQLEAEAKQYTGTSQPFFKVLKMLTLHGYFTSEIGATQALNYDPVPGGWTADMKIDDNTKAWTPVF